MIIEEKIWKSNQRPCWLAEIPLLHFVTQAESREEITEMVKDGMESFLSDVRCAVTSDNDSQLFISCDEPKKLMALILKRQRNKKGLTQEEVAKNMHAASVNDYAQYEQAKHMPTIEKLAELLHAIDPQLRF